MQPNPTDRRAELQAFITSTVKPALAMLPVAMSTLPAQVVLLAIGLQESRLRERRQLVGNPPKPVGPAASFWQMEQGGGCAGVLRHPASRDHMLAVCSARACRPTAAALWQAIQTDDVLATAAARLLLYTDPQRLPNIGDEAGAWALYLRVWRPGKPKPDTWPEMYARAADAVTNGGV